MKKYITGIVFLLFFGNLFAQENAVLSGKDVKRKSNHIFVTLGPGYNTFQDVKYSNLVYNGVGGLLGVGFENRKPNTTWKAGVDLSGGLINNDLSNTSGFVITPVVYLQNLRTVNEKLSVGGRWDILDIYINNRSGLGNNRTSALVSSNLFISGQYKIDVKKGRSWVFGMDLGLLSFNRENVGFAFNAPQNVLEDGEYNYQDPDLSNPFGLSFFELEPIGKFNNIRTSVTLRGKKRSSFTYSWQVKTVAETRGYPLTIGTHFFTYRLDLIYREK